MCHVHPRFKHQAERLLVRHNPRHKCRIVNRTLGIFGDFKRPKDGRRGDIERSANVSVVDESRAQLVFIPIVGWAPCRHGDERMMEKNGEADLPDGEVRSNACSPSETKRVSFQLVVDVPVRSYPALWDKLFGVWEYIRIARNAPAGGGQWHRIDFGCGLPVISEHCCPSRNAIAILRVCV